MIPLIESLAYTVKLPFTYFPVVEVDAPLIVGFVSKFNILAGALAVGRPLAIAVLLAAALLALTYLLPVVGMFFALENAAAAHAPKVHVAAAHAPARKNVWAMVAPLVLTCAIGVLLGFLPDAGPGLYGLAQQAAEAVSGVGGVFLAE